MKLFSSLFLIAMAAALSQAATIFPNLLRRANTPIRDWETDRPHFHMSFEGDYEGPQRNDPKSRVTFFTDYMPIDGYIYGLFEYFVRGTWKYVMVDSVSMEYSGPGTTCTLFQDPEQGGIQVVVSLPKNADGSKTPILTSFNPMWLSKVRCG